MKSFVRCPSCQRRLMVATDREGGKMRCPRCATPFALGSRLNPSSGGPAEFLAFELFDTDVQTDEIEVLDDEPPVVDIVPVVPVKKPVVRVVPIVPTVPRVEAGRDGIPLGQRRRPPRRDGGYAEYDDDDSRGGFLTADDDDGKYVYYHADESSWKLVHWGITLVLFAILLYAGGTVLMFIALAFSVAGGAVEEGIGILFIGFSLMLFTDLLRMIGYGLCINVPARTGARGWAIMALSMAIFSSIPMAIPLILASVIADALVLRGVAGLGVVMALASWASFLMFMERVAETFDERGIADSISAIIKLGGTWTACIIAGLTAQSIMLYRDPDGAMLLGADPSAIVFAVCAGSFQAFTAILGLIVFVKYIFALLNTRAMIDWST